MHKNMAYIHPKKALEMSDVISAILSPGRLMERDFSKQ